MQPARTWFVTLPPIGLDENVGVVADHRRPRRELAACSRRNTKASSRMTKSESAPGGPAAADRASGRDFSSRSPPTPAHRIITGRTLGVHGTLTVSSRNPTLTEFPLTGTMMFPQWQQGRRLWDAAAAESCGNQNNGRRFVRVPRCRCRRPSLPTRWSASHRRR